MAGTTRGARWGFGLLATLFAAVVATAADHPLVVASAEIEKTKVKGDSWDAFGGSPDPYVKASVNKGKVVQTAHKSDTFKPTWDEKVLTVSVGDTVNVEVWDKDALDHDLIGTHSFVVTKEMLADGVAKVKFDRVKELRITFGAGVVAVNPKEAAAKKLVEGQQQIITAALHPTSNVTDVKFHGLANGTDGYSLKATFHYTHFIDGNFTSEVEFCFDTDGKFTGVKAGKTTAKHKPFEGSNNGLKAFKAAAVEGVKAVTIAATRNEAAAGAVKLVSQQIADAVKAEDVLRVYLQFAQSQQKSSDK